MAHSGETKKIIEVPPGKRPKPGGRSIPLHLICMRGAEALESVVKQHVPDLDRLAFKLVNLAAASSKTLSPEDIAGVMSCANDLRGMASTMGSDITARIANAIFELCEAEPRRVTKPLVMLLAEAARQVVGYRSDADGGRLKLRIEALLADVRASIAAA